MEKIEKPIIFYHIMESLHCYICYEDGCYENENKQVVKDSMMIHWFCFQNMLVSSKTCHSCNAKQLLSIPERGTLTILENGEKIQYQVNQKGEKHGTWIQWYPTGQVKYRWTFVDGRETLYEAFYKNGNLEHRTHSLEGILHGLSEYWYENGQLLKQGNYLHGAQDGPYKQWYKNGKLKMTSHYIDNKKHGIHTSFDENGNVQSKMHFIHGRQTLVRDCTIV